MNGILPETRFLLAAKGSLQRKLPLFRRSGPATWGLHAPKTPKAEVGRPTGYANAVLLFALNACGPSSVLKFGSSPEPPQGEVEAPLSKGAGRVSGLGDSDGPCRTARYPRRRPGIPPPRLRSAPPFDKGGFDGPYVTARKRSPPPFPQTLQTLHALHKTCPLFAKPLPRLYRTMVETGAKPRYN